jgi:hypothetical protein
MLMETSASVEPIDYAALGREDASRAVAAHAHIRSSTSVIGASHEVAADMRRHLAALRKDGTGPADVAIWLDAFRRTAGPALNAIFSPETA